jgi:hypothetical protein
VKYAARQLRPRWIVAAEIAIICVWGGSILAIADALSGPYSIDRWMGMAAIWLGIPSAITGAFAGFGYLRIRRGNESAGIMVVAMPLMLLAGAAAWARFFG